MEPEIFDATSFKLSSLLTNQYSTSFSLGIKTIPPEYRKAIYAIYAFVRIGDEIVDTLHNADKRSLLVRYQADVMKAIEEHFSTNPILHAFQQIYHQYRIPPEYIDAYFISMEMDIDITNYSQTMYEKYIYGSAEVVGLMCLKVYCEGDDGLFNSLVEPARKLGSVFQKVNFLRDIKQDIELRGRIYIPEVASKDGITDDVKKSLEADIEKEFQQALDGIKKLPPKVQLANYSVFLYYYALFQKIQKSSLECILSCRVRVSNLHKLFLLAKAYIVVHMGF